jgi:S-layer homology domain
MRKIVGALIAVTLALLVVAFVSDPVEAIVLHGYFTDDDGSIFEADIDAIASAGITKGCNPPANTAFCPDDHVTRGQMAAFLRRGLALPTSTTNYFTDDKGSIFEADINALAAAGITKGCNPPTNTHYCPDDHVTRGQMAAFLRRALSLPATTTNYFTDDKGSIFVADINALAAAGITKGCNPPTNTHYCPDDHVTRGQMAAFLDRGLALPPAILRIPMGDYPSLSCSKNRATCTMTVDVIAGRTYRVQEGVFQVLPYRSGEQSDFTGSGTGFTLTVDGSEVSVSELATQGSSAQKVRYWRRDLSFSSGQHKLVGRWTFEGQLIQTTTITIRSG